MPCPSQPSPYWPDYHGASLVNLVASIAGALGGATHAVPLREPVFEAEALAERDVVLLLVDGMGEAQLARHGPQSFLRAHQHATLTSVFPSTTASAITSLHTGIAPAQHGLTGWEMWDPTLDAIVHPLTLATRFRRQGNPLRTDTIARTLFTSRSWFDTLARPAHALVPRALMQSLFNLHFTGRAQRHGYRDWDDMLPQLQALTAQSHPVFVYVYTAHLDHAMHESGPDDWAISRLFNTLDEKIEQFAGMRRNRPLTLLVCADHGFVATPRDKRIEWESVSPTLQGRLRLPLSGESRVRFCHVHDGQVDACLSDAQAELGAYAWVYRCDTLLREGAFGPGPLHPALAARIGDIALLMKDNYTLRDTLPGERPVYLKGAHAGVSAAEMRIPLIRIDIG